MVRSVVMAAGLALCAEGALAEDVGRCNRDLIVQLSEQVLRDRGEAGRFAVRRVGTSAAYLLMHYGGLSDEEMLALLSDLAQRDDRTELQDAREMALALAVNVYGVDEGLAYFGGRPAEEAARAGQHLQRAILLADAGESYFRLIEEARNDPSIEVDENQLFLTFQRLHVLVIDQSDGVLQEVSQNAEAAGRPDVAVYVAGNMSDLGRMQELIERYGADPQMGRAFDPVGIETTGTVWRTQRQSLRLAPIPVQVDLFEIARADSLSGPMGFIGIVTNMSGRTGPIAQVAREFIAAVEAGQISPFVDPEEGWLMVYRGLAREMGLEEIRRYMAGFQWPGGGVRHFADMGTVTMDRMITYNALGPAMKGAAFPRRPSLLGPEAPWEAFGGFVVALAEGRDVLPRTEEERILGFELLWRAGRHQDAIDWAVQSFEPVDRIAVFRDVMRRMDGRCDAVLAFPGQGLLFGSQPLYRFPPEPYMQ